MLSIITYDSALDLARSIEEDCPVEPDVKPFVARYCDNMRRYFPEFEGFVGLPAVFYDRTFEGDCFDERPDGTVVFDVQRACATRGEAYAVEYEAVTDAVADDILSVLSFGRARPRDAGEARRICDDVSAIWDASYPGRWSSDLARLKVGESCEIFKKAHDAGLDYAVDSYLAGVPLEHLVEDGAQAPSGREGSW